MKNYLKANKFKLASLALMILFLGGAIAMPGTGNSETFNKSEQRRTMHDGFKINIDATDKSNQEVEAEIRSKLNEVGIMNPAISFGTTPSGDRQINVKIPVESIQNQGGIELTIKDGKRISKIKEVNSSGPDGHTSFKDMTDAEIRNKIREETGDASLTDDMIQIDRSGGNLSIKLVNPDGSEKGMIKIEEEIK